MSMVVTVSVEVKDYNLLKKTLGKMNYRLIEEEGTDTTSLYDSSIEYCGIVTDKTGIQLCYIQKEQSRYRLAALSYEASPKAGKARNKKMLNSILQHYAYQEVMETARRNGWTTINTKQTDGTIRIRLAV